MNPDEDDRWPVEARWQCPRGHFIAESAITEEDSRDDGYYYGIRSECRYPCKACDRTYDDLPRCVPLRYATMAELVGGAS
jgi:hypothetical protein